MLFTRIKVFAITLLLGVFANIATMAQDPAAAPAGGTGDVAHGKEIFTNNCAACHKTDGVRLIGPGLAGVETRHSLAWIVKWVNNPAAMISSDADAKKLFADYKPTVMTAYPNYKQKDIEDILAYVASENVPKVAVVPPSGGGGGQTGGDANGGMFEYLVIGLLIVMIAVLVALLSVVNTLRKQAAGESVTTDGSQLSFWDALKDTLAKAGQNDAIKGGVIALFILVLGKVTMDAGYNIGMHQGYAPKQPIEFSHKLHAGEYKINCNYCHTGVYKTKGANIPSANICMNCHNQIKRDSPEIQKIYTAIEESKPIEWIRVHNLPDLAYFNHSQHTNVGGLECKNCHGEIEKMEVVEQRSSLTMGWCIDCHRKTNVNTEGNAYYDKLLEIHKKDSKEPLKVKDIGGLECSKCHY